jgi:hypothetical protein
MQYGQLIKICATLRALDSTLTGETLSQCLGKNPSYLRDLRTRKQRHSHVARPEIVRRLRRMVNGLAEAVPAKARTPLNTLGNAIEREIRMAIFLRR